MAGDERWYFTKEQLANTPSRKNGIDADKELSYRQQAANLIQDMGQRLQVSQLCINTAIVYMHRFYMFHSMTYFHRNQMALAALFLAAKVEEQPRKLEHVIRIAHLCLHRTDIKIDVNSDSYLDQAQDIVCHENILLQTLGFDVAIDHPHTHVVRCCQLVKACKDLAQTSYFMASNSLHLTTMCLQYKPTVVACFCIHLACKWAFWEIPQSNEGKPWYYYVDSTVTSEQLESMTAEFLHVFDRCPSRLRKRIMSMTQKSESPNRPLINSPFDCEPKKIQPDAIMAGTSGSNSLSQLSSLSRNNDKQEDKQKSLQTSSRLANDIYREKKERERMEREKATGISFSHHSSHSSHSMHKPGMPGLNKHQSANPKNAMHHHPHPKPEMMKPGQAAPPRPHNSGSSMPRDMNQRQKPRDYHMPVTQNQSHGLPSLDSSVENNKHQPHDKRNYDYRHKQPQPTNLDHRKESEHKLYHKRKTEVDFRSEEVRKLMEKPVSMKPREEQQKEEFLTHILKQSHKPSYVPEKPLTTNQSTVRTTTKIVKDPLRNGTPLLGSSSFSLNCSYEDNRPSQQPQRQDDSLKTPLPARQRSLFSPESTPVKSEPQRPAKYKQKTPPLATKVPKRENAPYTMPILDINNSYSNLNNQAPLESKQSEVTVNKKVDIDTDVDIKPVAENNFIKTEDVLINGVEVKSESTDEKLNLSDLKLNSSVSFGNGNPIDFTLELKTETDGEHHLGNTTIKKEEQLSPMKSAKSIKALLQEVIESPSLVSRSSISMPAVVPPAVSETVIPTTVDLRQLSIPLVPVQTTAMNAATPYTTTSSIINSSSFPTPSTVSEPSSISSDSQSIAMLSTPQTDDKKEHHKSEKKKKEKKHKHKEKEKSKEKHKHRHKDKEGRKNRDKERERDKDKDGKPRDEVPAAPIKITIPKEKLTMSTDLDKASPSAGLKIKIPKERIKAPESAGASAALGALASPPVPSTPASSAVQAPLKIKIRTSANSSEIAPAHDTPSRKRERDRTDDGPLPVPKRPVPAPSAPYVAPQLHTGSATQRPNERQNGRHYGASSSNKVRGRGTARGGLYPAQPRQSNFGNYRREPEFNNNAVAAPSASTYFYTNYPPPMYPPPGYMYDPGMFYQQQFTQQYMYPRNVVMTVDGAIDISVPPPAIVGRTQSKSTMPPSTNSARIPPLPHGPPPSLTPPPPPLPEGPPPDNTPPPPPPQIEDFNV